MKSFITQVGHKINQVADSAGYGVILFFLTLAHAGNVFRRTGWRAFLDQIGTACCDAIPVTLVVSIFVGMILALNGGITLGSIGQHTLIGRVVAVAMIREMGPFMTALILAASIGSAMAAEIGTMSVSEELDALAAMAIDPAKFLVLPRLLAMALLCPLMTAYASVVGIAGGALVAKAQLGVSFAVFRNDAVANLTQKDLFTGLFKAFVFGVIIALTGCTQGLRARGGAIGVGYATRRAVVFSYILIIISGYYITWFFYR